MPVCALSMTVLWRGAELVYPLPSDETIIAR